MPVSVAFKSFAIQKPSLGAKSMPIPKYVEPEPDIIDFG